MKRNRAVFTVCQNEPLFLPVWLNYYTRHFAPEDVYVLDHDSTDGSVAKAWRRFNPSVVQVHRGESFNHAWLRDTVQAFQRFLLQSYENVLFAEVDEIVVPDLRAYPAGLSQYVQMSHLFSVVRCVGFDVVHQSKEPPLDWDLPIMAQRSFMWSSALYSKPLLAKIPLAWGPGFHTLEVGSPPSDPDLMLIHLHRVDYDACLARHRSAADRTWSKEDLKQGLGYQNRITETAEFDRWFRTYGEGERRHTIDRYLKGAF